MTFAVIGLGFGDEGKGLVTDYLLSSLSERVTNWKMNNPVVVRYSGGQQAAHTVRHDSFEHVFSNFGSGTLRGAPTYWSEYCTFDPVEAVKELLLLNEYGCKPKLYVSGDAPVTTPWDKYHNQNSEIYQRHGTCGHGVGATFQREENFYHLKFRDLYNPMIMRFKMDAIKSYYNLNRIDMEDFIGSVREIRNSHHILLYEKEELDVSHSDIIFEGSQGLLLDQHYGFFPHVTRSNTGTKNIIKMGYYPDLYLVTRAYQTRHGNGPISYEQEELHYDNFDSETNEKNKYQGEFRRSILDLDLLDHGIQSDDYIRIHKESSTLVITCVDQLKAPYKFAQGGQVNSFNSERQFLWAIKDAMGMTNILVSRGPQAKDIERFI